MRSGQGLADFTEEWEAAQRFNATGEWPDLDAICEWATGIITVTYGDGLNLGRYDLEEFQTLIHLLEVGDFQEEVTVAVAGVPMWDAVRRAAA